MYRKNISKRGVCPKWPFGVPKSIYRAQKKQWLAIVSRNCPAVSNKLKIRYLEAISFHSYINEQRVLESSDITTEFRVF